MTNKTKYILGSLIIFLVACTKDKKEPYIGVPSQGDYIIFGEVYGACFENCETAFLLTNEFLYSDVKDRSGLKFRIEPMEKLLFDKSQIMWNLPNRIFSENIEEALFQILYDFDYIIKGRKDDEEFEIRYDSIDVVNNNELLKYSEEMIELLKEL